MGYNRENYSRIRESFRTKYLKAYEEADRRRDMLHGICPELAEIDRKLSATGAKIALAAMGTGEEAGARLAAVREENLALQARREALLAGLGYPADYTKPVYECPLCEDSGFVNNKMCECMRRELVMAAYESSGLGQLMRTQSFESFQLTYYAEGEERERMARNLEILRRYALDFGKQTENLILCGATGLGKTHLSTSLARALIERGFDVYYATAQQMFFDFEHARFGTESGMTPAADLTRYSECELLILDDLGAEVSNQFTNSCLYMVLNNRINLSRPTVINTNLAGREIKERYADRIASRILGDFKPLVFSGTDVRRQKLTAKA